MSRELFGTYVLKEIVWPLGMRLHNIVFYREAVSQCREKIHASNAQLVLKQYSKLGENKKTREGPEITLVHYLMRMTNFINRYTKCTSVFNKNYGPRDPGALIQRTVTAVTINS